jgi:hypothetical protein
LRRQRFQLGEYRFKRIDLRRERKSLDSELPAQISGERGGLFVSQIDRHFCEMCG